MIIRNAEDKDIPKILEIYQSAVDALRESGIDQWQNGYPNETSARRDIDLGISRICEDEGKIVATAAAYVGNELTYDRIFEGAWCTDSREYGIVHRIAVSPEFKKGGIASRFMEFTAELAKKSGVNSLRCDTHRNNFLMQKTLKKNGYVYCGIIYLEDGAERFGYEKILAETTDNRN
ncbi:MAG: GNAT family N-acetyltransferase [Oscillospiraceae bacterium]